MYCLISVSNIRELRKSLVFSSSQYVSVVGSWMQDSVARACRHEKSTKSSHTNRIDTRICYDIVQTHERCFARSTDLRLVVAIEVAS